MGTMVNSVVPVFKKEIKMADLIQIKRGDKTGTTFLSDGELGYSREEKALYIGDGGKRNQKLCSAETAAEVERVAAELPNKLTATAIPAMDTLSAESDLSAVIGAVNSLISAMKASGIMK